MARDRDGLYTRPDSPYWYASWIGPDGRRRRRCTKRVAKREARRVAERWRVEGERAGQGSAAHYPTVAEALTLYLQDLAKRSRADGPPSAAYPIHRLLGHRRLPLTAADVVGYSAEREVSVCSATIHNELSLLGTVLNWTARTLDLPLPNPVTGRKPPAARPRSRWLAQDEVDRLLQTAGDGAQADYMPDLLRLCLLAGLRVSEALRLSWEQVDLERRLIYFSPATQKADRLDSVPLNDAALALLMRRRQVRALSGLVIHRQGRAINRTVAARAFARIAERAGVADVQLRDLRRTAGSWMVQRGVALQVVSRVLRHADVSITARVYAHLDGEQVRAGVEVL